MSLSLMSIAGTCVASFIVSMNLNALLLEQHIAPGLTALEIGGRPYEKQMQENECTILNLRHPQTLPIPFSEWINAIVIPQADMLCIQGLTSIEEAHNICESLQDHYAHFLYVDPNMSEKHLTSNLEKMLIAHKHSFLSVDSNSITANAVNFILETYLLQENTNTPVLSYLTEEAGPDYIISTNSVCILGNVEALSTHIVRNTPYSTMDQNFILAKQNTQGNGGSGSSVQGTLGLSIGPKGTQWNVGVEGTIRDSRGNSLEGRIQYDSSTKETQVSVSGSCESTSGESRGTIDGPNDK